MKEDTSYTPCQGVYISLHGAVIKSYGIER